MKRILSVGLYMLILSFGIFGQQAMALSSSPGEIYSIKTFEKLGIELKENIATTYFVGDGILIQGRVTNKKEYARVILQNSVTGEKIDEIVHTKLNGDFQIPISFPKIEGKYYIIVVSGNSSFETNIIETLTLVPKNTTPNIKVSIQSINPYIVYGEYPYLSFGADKWANMQIDQFGKRYNTSGKVFILNELPLTFGRARVTINGYALSSSSPLDQVQSLGFNWSGYIYIDRIRDKIGENLVALRVLQSHGVMQFRIKSGEQILSTYYLTSPNGNVTKHAFPANYIDTNGFLHTNITIRQNFPMPEFGVYKIETVRNSGIAYFNIPISKSQFWSIIEPLADLEKKASKIDKKIVNHDILTKINTIRGGLGISLLTVDERLTNLAELKALYLTEHDDVIHVTKEGLDIRGFGKSKGININGALWENIAKGNISHLYLQDGLEESGSHRHAMIEPKIKKIGIGYAIKNNITYLVQVFGE